MRCGKCGLVVMALALFSVVAEAALVEKIIFNSNREGGQNNIWMMNPDGSGLEVLIPGPVSYVQVSPDGTRVAFLDYSSGSPVLKVVELATGTVTPVAAVGAFVDWVADGSGFLGATGGCGGDPIRIGLDGSISAPFTEGGRQAFGDVDWNTDRMYYTTDPCSSPSTAIRVWDPVTGIASTVKPANGRSEGHVSVSPDGSMLTFFEHDSGYSDPAHIYVMHADGTGLQRVTTTTGYRDFHPVFSPDGARIVFTRVTSLSPGASEIRVVDPDTGAEELILPADGFHRSYGWAHLDLPPVCEFGPESPLEFVRTAGKPVVESASWDSCGGLGRLLVEVDGVRSAIIWLNDVLVAGPSDFHGGTTQLSIPVVLAEGPNTLEVELRSKPGSRIVIDAAGDE